MNSTKLKKAWKLFEKSLTAEATLRSRVLFVRVRGPINFVLFFEFFWSDLGSLLRDRIRDPGIDRPSRSAWLYGNRFTVENEYKSGREGIGVKSVSCHSAINTGLANVMLAVLITFHSTYLYYFRMEIKSVRKSDSIPLSIRPLQRFGTIQCDNFRHCQMILQHIYCEEGSKNFYASSNDIIYSSSGKALVAE